MSGSLPLSVAPNSRQAYVPHAIQAVDTTVFAMQAALKGTAGDMRLAVRNDSGLDIGPASLLMNGLAWHLGPIEAAGSAERRLGGDGQVLDRDALSLAVGAASDERERKALATYLLGQFEQQARRDARLPAPAYLVGRLNRPIERLDAESFVSRREFWFVIAPVRDPAGLAAIAPSAPLGNPAGPGGPPASQEHL